MRQIYSDYMTDALMRRQEAITFCVGKLAPHVAAFDTIAFRGMSGALIAPIVADKLNKSLTLVRKQEVDEHKSHAEYPVEGALFVDYVIVDDFTNSGRTLREIQKRIFEAERYHCVFPSGREVNHGRCLAVCLYRSEQLILNRGSDICSEFLNNMQIRTISVPASTFVSAPTCPASSLACPV